MRAVLVVSALLAALLATSGCGVRRVLAIDTRPSGATVYVNGTARGTTPLRLEYVHDGLFTLRLEKEGYAPRAEEVRTQTTLDALPGVDFFAEHLGPRRERVATHTFDLTPLQRTPYSDAQMDDLLRRADGFRERLHREVEEPGTPTPTRPPPPPRPPPTGTAGAGTPNR